MKEKILRKRYFTQEYLGRLLTKTQRTTARDVMYVRWLVK
jgi:hypothetical protein